MENQDVLSGSYIIFHSRSRNIVVFFKQVVHLNFVHHVQVLLPSQFLTQLLNLNILLTFLQVYQNQQAMVFFLS